MPNATARVAKAIVPKGQLAHAKRSVETLAAETTYYTNAWIGVDVSGYYSKFDDTESMIFAGVVRGEEGNPVLPAGTAGDGTIDLSVSFPDAIEVAISGVAVTDIGKKVYATFDATGTLDASATTYANLLGIVIDYVASGIALVAPVYDGIAAHARLNATKVLAATGAQSLTKFDLNKTILVPNTGAYSITLPAVADTQAGDRLTFIKTTSDAVAATLDGNASETIDGATTLATVDAQFDTVQIVSTGTAWIVSFRDIT